MNQQNSPFELQMGYFLIKLRYYINLFQGLELLKLEASLL